MIQEQQLQYQQQLQEAPTQRFDYWFERLDFEREVLQIDERSWIIRKDLQVLHHILHGMPRKVMAERFNVSVKTIEKRMERLKLQLYHDNCQCYNLHGCCRAHKLTTFVMAKEDWFDPASPLFHYQ